MSPPMTLTMMNVVQLDDLPFVWIALARLISAIELANGVLILERLVSSLGTNEEMIARSDSLNNSVALRVIGMARDSYCSSRAGKHRHLYILLLAVQSRVWGRLITFKPCTRKL